MTELVPPELDRELDAGRKSSTLAFALFCLPKERREDMSAYYRFCRLVDDIADSDSMSVEQRRKLLDGWQAALQSGHGIPEFLAALISKYDLERPVLGEIVRGVSSDLAPVRFESFDELRTYCWRVASAVGIGCLPIFGADRGKSRAFAENLGLALQLTNIIRDIGEDLRSGRIYLPQDEIARLEATSFEETSAEFQELMKFQARRAREFYDAARHDLPKSERPYLKAPQIMMALYFHLLEKMERDGFRVISRRYRLSRFEKLRIALPMLFAR